MQKLPKSLASNTALQNLLSACSKPLPGVESFLAPQILLTPELEKALSFAKRCGRVRGGLESIEVLLRNEAQGHQKVASSNKSSTPSGASRLLIISNDGSERFYRDVASLAQKHDPRVMVLFLDQSSEDLGKRFFGADAKVKALLVTEKEFVLRCLMSLEPIL
jgi:hypothetical protein